ncbi:hypothetical protein BGZ76_002652 [Entomortierella beljakovae]|nr:hypothetical protein BGZ76_002652 [Entomortierella beljakovae]
MHSFKPHLTLLSIVAYSALVSAQQSYTPITTSLAVSAIAENQGFYVLGGFSDGQLSQALDQAFYIDLSTSWNTANPPFQRLPNGYKVYRTASTMLKDNKKWLVIANSTGLVYDIPSSNWTSIGGTPSVSDGRGLVAVTDPGSGTVYVPNGYVNVFSGDTELLNYDITKDTVSSSDNQPGFSNIVNYGATWSSKIDSVVVFGGIADNTFRANNNIYVYSPKNGWSTPTVKGTIPEARFLPCFAAADSGSKIVLFGGLAGSATNSPGPALGDLYTLDVGSWTWTKGADLPSGVQKYQTCGVSGDYLISWGGVSGASNTAANSTFLYNIKTSSWTSDYVPSKALTSSKVAIIAGCVGGVVLIALIVGALIWRRRRKGKNQKKAPFLHHPNEQGQQRPGELIALVPNDQLYPQTHQHNTPPQGQSTYPQQAQSGHPDQQQQQQQQQRYSYQGQQVSQGYQPQVSQGYQPQVSQGYQQQVSQGYQLPISQDYQPQVSQAYQPQVSQAYQPAGGQHVQKQVYESSPVPAHNSTGYYAPASYGQNPASNHVPVTQVSSQPNYGQQPVYGQQTYQQQGYQQ